MKLGALISTATLVALAIFACVPPPSPPGPPPPTGAPAPPPPGSTRAFLGCQPQSIDASNFVARKVSLLPAGFVPQATGSQYQTPVCAVGVNIPANISADLTNAFSLAHPHFRDQLCGLTCIFINQTPCKNPRHCTVDDVTDNSWGYREQQQSQSPNGGRYIATSAALWERGHPDALSVYEGKVLGRLTQLPTGSAPSHGPAMPNNKPEATVLAALAHELGHVRWYDANVPVPGGPYDFGRTLPCSNGAFRFFDGSWQYTSTSFLEIPNRWRNFGERVDPTVIANGQLNHRNAPQLRPIYDAIDRHDVRALGPLNAALHQNNQPWASFFGMVTPDEDFVETYRLWVLKEAGLQSFPVTIPHGNGNNPASGNIIADLLAGNKMELGRKIDCVAAIP